MTRFGHIGGRDLTTHAEKGLSERGTIWAGDLAGPHSRTEAIFP